MHAVPVPILDLEKALDRFQRHRQLAPDLLGGDTFSLAWAKPDVQSLARGAARTRRRG